MRILAGPTFALAALISTSAGAQTATDPSHLDRAQPKADGVVSSNLLSPELVEVTVASGTMPVENPSAGFTHYGFAADGPFMPKPLTAAKAGEAIEATKTEPDKNTYLVLKDQTGGSAGVDYGQHFVFQGHENGREDATAMPLGLITRINLDADAAHRVTIMAERDSTGTPLPFIDGSSWNPFAQKLLFSSEEEEKGGLLQAGLEVPSKVETLYGIAGRGSYEGVQIDSTGAIWIVEDVGGKKGKAYPHAKQPNSFVYRFTPTDRTDLLKGGRLEALQVLTSAGQPVVFHDGDPDGDINSQGMKELHAFGTRLKTRWVLLHDTAVDGMEPFAANALAKVKQATPFKRPENGQFRPGSSFREFIFTETGDSSAKNEVGPEVAGFGALLRLTQDRPDAAEGEISVVYRGDLEHSGFDNPTFWSDSKVLVVEDASDSLHSERKAFDSGYLIDLKADYADPATRPVRVIALGRDPLAAIDSAISDMKVDGFANDGDNEITGIHVSDGDASVEGLIGTRAPTPFSQGWRVFFTQQHGLNTLHEILPRPGNVTN